MLKNQTIAMLFFLLLWSFAIHSQEVKIFKVTDFDLNGAVKSCLVNTDYGKEEYQFDEKGRLIEAVTRYNEGDYDMTRYKFKNGALIEKRVESYRDQSLDKAISIANFYTYDSTKNYRITEKIVTYEKEFLEQYEYSYTSEKKLSRIVRTNNEGIDETSVVYYDEEGSANANFILNREIQKSIRTKTIPLTDSTTTNSITTKKFLEGKPNTAIEEVFDSSGKVSIKKELVFDVDLEKFIAVKKYTNEYDANGALLKSTLNSGGEKTTKEFIYQYDDHENWIKQISTPGNAYKTRKIDYFENKDAVKVEE